MMLYENHHILCTYKDTMVYVMKNWWCVTWLTHLSPAFHFLISVKVSLPAISSIITLAHYFDYTNSCGARRLWCIDWYLLSFVCLEGINKRLIKVSIKKTPLLCLIYKMGFFFLNVTVTHINVVNRFLGLKCLTTFSSLKALSWRS